MPLGQGRFRTAGSDGGHNGVKSVLHHLQRQDVARLRLGIGPFRRPLVDFVLEEWTDDEWDRIDALDAPFARFMEHLGSTEDLKPPSRRSRSTRRRSGSHRRRILA